MRKVAAVFSVLLILSLGLAGSLVALTGTVQAGHGSGDVVTVNTSGGGINTTIQAGVNHADPGDTVFVESGTYNESVVVNKTDITIVTNESVTLNGSSVTGPAFNVTSAEGNVSNVAISGFSIANYETGVSVDGVEATTPPPNLDMRNITVLNNTFRNISGTAVSVSHESGEFELLNILNNTITNASDGVSVSVDGGVSTENITILNNSMGGEIDGSAVSVSAGGSATTLTDISVFLNNGSESSTGLDVSVQDSASIADLNVTGNEFAATDGDAVTLESGITSDSTAELSEVTVDSNALNASGTGLRIAASANGTISDVSVTENNASRGSDGLVIASDGVSSEVEDIDVTDVLLNETDGTGLQITATDGDIRNVSLTDVDAQNNDAGLDVSATGDATISNLSTDTVGFGESAADAGTLQATDGTIEDVEFVSTGFNESDGTGLTLLADGGEIQTVSLDTVSAQNNSVGLNVSALSGNISGLSTDTVGFGESEKTDSDAGVLNAEGSSATIENVDFSLTGFNETDGTGLQIIATDGEVRNVSMDTVLAANNSAGLNATATGSGVIEDLSFETTGFNESDGTGLTFLANDGTIQNISMDTVTAGNNNVGIEATATGSGTISGISTDVALFGESDGDAGVFEATGTNAVIEDLSFASTGFNESDGTGLTLSADDGEIRDISLDTVLAANNSAGLNATATGSGVIEDLSFETAGFNESDGTGLTLSADDGEIRDISLNTVTAGNNNIGIDASATGTGLISGISTDTALFGESNGDAGVFEAVGSDAVIENLSFESTGFNESDGTGLRLLANDGTIQNISMDTVIAGNNSVGIDATASGEGTISGISTDTALFGESNGDAGVFEATDSDAVIEDLAFELTGFNNSDGTGLTLLADDGTIRDISLDTVITSDNTVGANATAAGTGLIENVSANTVLFSGNDDGLRLGAVDDARIEDVQIERSGLNETTNAAVVFDGDGGAYSGVKVFESLIRNNNGAGVLITENTNTEGLRVQRSLIADNRRGVVNQNETGVFDARNNWWGDSSGPSSALGGDTPYADPVNGKLAIGDGDSVSEGATAGISNVRFDPAIGGKNRNEEDNQLIDPIAVGEDQNIDQIPEFSVEFAGQTIEGPVSDFVGLNLWERSVLPFRSDDADAATKVRNPEVVFRTEDGDVSINRDFINVYQSGESLNVTFDQTTGANTSRFAGTEVQFHVFRANGSLSGAFSQSINQTTGEVSVGSDDVAIVELRDLGEIDTNGTVNVEFTPNNPGEYLFALTTVESGDGFELNETGTGRLSANVLNDSTVFVGFEAITVQRTSSTVTPTKTNVTPGERVDFNAESNFEGDNVNHAVLLFDKAAYEDRLVVIDNASVSLSGEEQVIQESEITASDVPLIGSLPFSGIIPDSINETVPADTARINVTGFIDGEPFLVSVNVTSEGCDPLNSPIPYSISDAEADPCVNDITTSGAIEGIPFSVGVVQSGDNRETLTLEAPTGINFENGEKTLQFVHAAVSGDNTQNRSTQVGTITARGPEVELPEVELPDEVDFGEVGVGETATESVTITNTGNTTLAVNSVDISGADTTSFAIVGEPNDTVAPGASTTVDIVFVPNSEGNFSAQLDVETNDSETGVATVSLIGTGEPVATPSIEVDPEQIDFGEVGVGETATESVTVSNTGGAPLEVSSVNTSGADTGVFTIVSDPSDTVAPGESTTVEVEFAPDAEGNFSAQLNVESNDSEVNIVSVALSGAGEAVAVPSIEVDPEQIDFDGVEINNTATESVTVTNTGNATLEISSTEVAGADASAFTVVSDPSDTVAPGESTTVEVEFAPETEGDLSAQVDIESNDTETGVVTVDLSGTGEPEEPPEPPVVPIAVVTILLILGILAAVYLAGTG